MNSSNNISDNNLLSMPFELYPQILKYIDNPNTVAHVCKLFYAILYSDSYMYNHYSKEVNSLLGGTIKLIKNPEKFPNLLCLKKSIIFQVKFLDKRLTQHSPIPSAMKKNFYSYDIFSLSKRFEFYNSHPFLYDNEDQFYKIYSFIFIEKSYLKCAEKIVNYFERKPAGTVSMYHSRTFQTAIDQIAITGEQKEFLPHLLTLNKTLIDGDGAILCALIHATLQQHKDIIQTLLPHIPDNERSAPFRNKAIELLKSMETPEKPNRN